MALRTANSDTDLSSVTGWDSTTNTPGIHATTNITISTGGVNSATYTAPNTTNAVTGCWVLMATKPATAGITLTLTLQEATVNTAAVATMSADNIGASGEWVYFRFATPYVFTATTAGRYRFQLKASVAISSGAAADAAGTAFAYVATDDRTGALASTDDLWIGSPNLASTRTVTYTGTSNLAGSGADTVLTATTSRSVGYAITISKGAILSADTTVNSTLTVKGHIGVSGELRLSTNSVKPAAGTNVKLVMDQNGVSGNYGILTRGVGKVSAYGRSLSLWKTKYASGTGIAADPLIVADAVNWDVGDEIVISASSDNATNYNETDARFIITKNSSTSYVLSNTKGGAEAALTNTHNTNAWVVNIERNVIISSTSVTLGWYYNNSGTSGIGWDTNWARVEYYGTAAGTGNKEGLRILNSATTTANTDYLVGYKGLGSLYFTGAKYVKTFTGLVAYGNNSTTSITGAFNLVSANNSTFVDCFCLALQRGGWFMQAGGANYTFTNCYCVGGNILNSAINGGWACNNVLVNFSGCEVHAWRNQGMYLNSAVTYTFTNCQFGTKGLNGIASSGDLLCASDTYNGVLFDNCLFGSTPLITNYTAMINGSEIRFNKYQQTVNNHFWYTPYGVARSTGAALADTTVRTPNSLALRLAPEDATNGFTWSFNIPAKAMSIVNFFGWFQKNAAFATDVCRVELWLPGSSAADATATLSNVTGAWQAAVLSAQNNNAVDGLATINVVALTATASAYIYVDDLYNAGDTVTSSDKVTGLDTWYQGKPLSIIQPSATSAADIWNFPTTNLTTAGTTGIQVKKLLTVGKFLGLK